MTRPSALLRPLFLTILLLASPARADNAAEADKLFKEARALTKAGKLAEACPKYEASLALDPSAGAAFRLGECYRDTGQSVRAWELFAKAADLARADGRADRVSQAEDAAKELLPKLALMALSISPAAASIEGLAIKLDGEGLPHRAWSKAKALTPGTHVIEASAPGRSGWRSTITVKGGDAPTIEVPVLEPVTPPVRLAPAPKKQEDAAKIVHGPDRRIIITGGVTAGAALLAGLGLMVGSFVKGGEFGDALDKVKTDPAYKSRCDGGATSVCPSYVTDPANTKVLLANASFYSFLAAGALGGGTLAYALIARSNRSDASKKAAVVTVTPWAGGLVATGQW